MPQASVTITAMQDIESLGIPCDFFFAVDRTAVLYLITCLLNVTTVQMISPWA